MGHKHITISKSNTNGGPLGHKHLSSGLSLTFDFSILIDRTEMRFHNSSCHPGGPITSVILMGDALKNLIIIMWPVSECLVHNFEKNLGSSWFLFPKNVFLQLLNITYYNWYMIKKMMSTLNSIKNSVTSIMTCNINSRE